MLDSEKRAPKKRVFSLFVKRPWLSFILLLLFAGLAFVKANYPDVFPPKIEEKLGLQNQRILLASFIISFLLLLPLINYLLDYFRTDKTGKLDDLVIPWTSANEQYIKQAKEALKNDKQKEALDCLEKINTPELNKSISPLESRLSRINRKERQDVISSDEANKERNRILKAILELISEAEESMRKSGNTNAKIRVNLKTRYETRLAQKLAGKKPIKLQRSPSTLGTSRETSEIFIPFNSDEIKTPISQIFREAKRRLLIIGKPGSGKTILLLELALELLEEKSVGVPVILNLATWESKYDQLEDWLKEILPTETGTNKMLVESILEEIPLTLLLDGFDEIQKEERSSFLEAIGVYREVEQRGFVITSRIDEYREEVKDALVNQQVEISSLTSEQLKDQLEDIGHTQTEAPALLRAIEKNPVLEKVAQTPFYFNVLQLLFTRQRLSDMGFQAGDPKGQQQEIVEQFLHTFLHSPKKKWSQGDSVDWLSFLASRMNHRNMVAFELTDLQYSWSTWSGIDRRLASVASGLAEGLVKWLVGGVAFGIFGGILSIGEEDSLYDQVIERPGITLLLILFSGLIGGLMGWLVIGPLFNFFSRESTPKLIETKDVPKWSWKQFFQFFKIRFMYWLLIPLGLGMIGGLLGGLMSLFETGPGDALLFFILLLGFGLVFGLGAGLVMGLLLGIYDMMTKSYHTFLQINRPYQRFVGSMKVLHFSILQHWLLRFRLHRKGLLPWQLVPFLEDMQDNHILESDGASWRFRHRIIQDFFAEKWQGPKEEISDHEVPHPKKIA